MTLPSKVFPAQFEQWTPHYEHRRPVALEPVGDDTILPPGIHPRMVSSVYGKIVDIVLYVPGKLELKPDEARTFGYINSMVELVEEMGRLAPRHFIIVVEKEYHLPEELEKTLREEVQQQGSKLSIVPIAYLDRTLSPWVQDAFVSIAYQVDGQYQHFLVESVVNLNAKDSIKEVLDACDLPDYTFQLSGLPMVGGNILSSKNFTLVGLHDSCRELLDKIGKDWLSEALVVLSSSPSKFSKKWQMAKRTDDGIINYYQGVSEDQVLYHIDLFIALAGRGLRRRKTEYIVVGEPCLGFEGLEQAPDDVQAMVNEMLEETSKGIDNIIEQLKTQLDALNVRFKIIRCPLPLTYFDQVKRIGGRKEYKRHWCWVTYCNALVESYLERGKPVRRVYLPSYGSRSNYKQYDEGYGDWSELAAFDKQAKEVWEGIDYEVVAMQVDYNPYIFRQGSLNCITNVIKRL